jgi:plasmid stabilization system protein ParE
VPHRLSWLPEALADLIRLREFIHVHNPAAAGRAANRIRETVGKLPDNPLIGKSVDDIDDPTLRELFIPFGQGGYWLRYLVREENIIIVRIWHGRENRDIKS